MHSTKGRSASRLLRLWMWMWLQFEWMGNEAINRGLCSTVPNRLKAVSLIAHSLIDFNWVSLLTTSFLRIPSQF